MGFCMVDGTAPQCQTFAQALGSFILFFACLCLFVLTVVFIWRLLRLVFSKRITEDTITALIHVELKDRDLGYGRTDTRRRSIRHTPPQWLIDQGEGTEDHGLDT